MKRREVVKALEAAGFVVIEGGNHTKFKHPDGRWTVVPRHKEVVEYTVRQIERQVQIKIRK